MKVSKSRYAGCALWVMVAAGASGQRGVTTRGDATVVVEGYAPNIVRVTLSLRKDDALAGPGYGILAKAATEGWTTATGAQGEMMMTSAELRVRVAGEGAKRAEGPLSADEAQTRRTQKDIGKYFNGSTPGVGLEIERADGTELVRLEGWQMSVPNYKDGNADILYDRRPSDAPFYQVGASFDAPKDAHYYGLGQNQEGYLDRRGHAVRCAHDYNAPGGQSVCVPFVVTNKGYAILWDNPSSTTVAFGFNDQVRWTSDVGQRVSFFVIAGKSYDELYEGYRLLTGDVPMLPKSAYGYIQCKQRYTDEAQLLAVAEGYRQRHYPVDDLVLDWFHDSKMGENDMNPADWPTPEAMNAKLHAMGFHTMISVWPRFVPQDRYYATLLKNGWFMHLADGTPTNGLPYDRAGSDIDTTNPEAAKWYWQMIRENYVAKGFDSFWMDETEPDLPPNGSYFKIGPGTEFFNAYPLFHTAAVYEGFRKDLKTRALVLARDAYIGAQHNGTMFWSSDISGNWDTLRRQLPTGINFVASGMPYWSTDIGGWQYLPESHTPERPVLIDPSDARNEVGHDDDYPELYVRWFEYGALQPIFRAHGSRPENEVWSYGRQAEPILVKYLRLRYQLMPYLYSVAWKTHQTGAPFMRGLFMDFGADPKVADIGDEYMFGPALLVAPVTGQGETSREVYLPAGTDWYNFWTNERLHGGQAVRVSAPIDVLPLFVKAGSVLPLGEPVENTNQLQRVAEVRVYEQPQGGSYAPFTLYRDDGNTYAYEQGEYSVTQLQWNEATGVLSRTGAVMPVVSDKSLVKVVGR